MSSRRSVRLVRTVLTGLAVGALGLGVGVPAQATELTGGAVDLGPGVVDDNPSSKPKPSKSSSPKPKPKPSKHKKPAKKTPGGTCKASFYSDPQPTANGERFNPNALTAASKTLKFNSRVKVTNRANGKSVTVRINDRGPYVSGRCLDLSRAAMKKVKGTGTGVIGVKWKVL